MNIVKLSEEQLKKLSENQLLEVCQYIDKWFLTPPEVRRRKDLLEQKIIELKINSPTFNDYFLQNYKSGLAVLDIAISIKPVKDKWLCDFIIGMECGNSIERESVEKAIQLTKPIYIVLALFISTKPYQDYFMDRSIPESDTLEIVFNNSLKEIVNTRNALKTMADQKRLILIDPKQIKKLKLEYLLEQSDLVKEFNKHQPGGENPHSRIFTSAKAFSLFEHWHNEISETSKLAEYSFIYRAMIMDGFIHKNVRPTEYIDFLDKNYERTLSEIKTYDLCKGGNKRSRYSAGKRLFKL